MRCYHHLKTISGRSKWHRLLSAPSPRHGRKCSMNEKCFYIGASCDYPPNVCEHTRKLNTITRAVKPCKVLKAPTAPGERKSGGETHDERQLIFVSALVRDQHKSQARRLRRDSFRRDRDARTSVSINRFRFSVTIEAIGVIQ